MLSRFDSSCVIAIFPENALSFFPIIKRLPGSSRNAQWYLVLYRLMVVAGTHDFSVGRPISRKLEGK
jgi:hypothetical protein